MVTLSNKPERRQGSPSPADMKFTISNRMSKESRDSVVNEDINDQDLRNRLIEKARIKYAMLKAQKVQSKIEAYACQEQEKTRSTSPKFKITFFPNNLNEL